MFFSKKIRKLNISKTAEVVDLALSLKSKGHKVINMASGELSFKPALKVRKEACRVINRGQTLYTQVAGLKELRELICQKIQSDLNVKYREDEIIVSNGGKQVIYNALQSTLNPGDEVIIVSPYWVSYPEIVKLCQGKPKVLESKRENGFSIDTKKLEKLITSKSKWLILNSPNNPTGAVYSAKNLKEVTHILRKFPNLWILTDDIYEKLNYTSAKNINVVTLDEDLKKRSLVVNGFSKGYCMTGWRLGYGAGPKELIEAMKKLQSQSTSAANTIAQNAAIKALQLEESYFANIRAALVKNRDIISSTLSNIEGFKLNSTQGAFYLFPSIENFKGKRLKGKTRIVDDISFCMQLLESENVAVVPGSSFGNKDSIRISYAISEKDLRIACKRIEHFWKKLI